MTAVKCAHTRSIDNSFPIHVRTRGLLPHEIIRIEQISLLKFIYPILWAIQLFLTTVSSSFWRLLRFADYCFRNYELVHDQKGSDCQNTLQYNKVRICVIKRVKTPQYM